MMIFEKLRPKNAIPRGLPPHNISFHTTKSFDEKANSALNIGAMWFSSDIASLVVVHTQVWVECWFLFYGVSYIFQSDENCKYYNTKRYLEIWCFFNYSTFVQTSALSSTHNIAKQCQKRQLLKWNWSSKPNPRIVKLVASCPCPSRQSSIFQHPKNRETRPSILCVTLISWYRVSIGHLCLYISEKVEIWSGDTDAWLTHRQQNIVLLSFSKV